MTENTWWTQTPEAIDIVFNRIGVSWLMIKSLICSREAHQMPILDSLQRNVLTSIFLYLLLRRLMEMQGCSSLLSLQTPPVEVELLLHPFPPSWSISSLIGSNDGFQLLVRRSCCLQVHVFSLAHYSRGRPLGSGGHLLLVVVNR